MRHELPLLQRLPFLSSQSTHLTLYDLHHCDVLTTALSQEPSLPRNMMPERSESNESKTMSQSNDTSNPREESPRTTPMRIDGGLTAWLQVLGAFCLCFTTW